MKNYTLSEHFQHSKRIKDCSLCQFNYWFSGKMERDERRRIARNRKRRIGA